MAREPEISSRNTAFTLSSDSGPSFAEATLSSTVSSRDGS